MRVRYFVIAVAAMLACSLLVSNARTASPGPIAFPDPIAFGYVQEDGKVGRADPYGVSCVWNAQNSYYMITIPGEKYYFTKYVTVVTPLDRELMASSGSGDDKLIVELKDRSHGTSVRGKFGFVTYKLSVPPQ